MTDPIYTTAEAAALLGLSAIRVRQLAQAGVGRKIHNRQWVFTASEIDRLRRRVQTPGPRPRTEQE